MANPAAFVALTVAGQQGNSRAFFPSPKFWIADFGLGAESKI